MLLKCLVLFCFALFFFVFCFCLLTMVCGGRTTLEARIVEDHIYVFLFLLIASSGGFIMSKFLNAPK